MSKPFFSILVPVYRNVEYLRDCLQSILKQNFDDYEVIVCYQGDTEQDKTIQDKRIKNIYLEKPSLYLARIESYHKAEGEYVLFVDSDDELLDDALSFLHRVIVNNVDVDIIQFGYTSVKEKKSNKESTSENRMLSQQDYRSYFLTELGTYPVCRKCFKRNKVEFYDEDIFLGEDALLSLAFINASQKVLIRNEIIYYYRPNPKSGTSRKPVKHVDDLATFLLHSIPYRKSNAEIEMLIFSFTWTFLNNYCRNEAFDYFSLNNVRTIFEYIEGKEFYSFPLCYQRCYKKAMQKRSSYKFEWIILRIYIRLFGIKSVKIKIKNE